jgi:hypothetical protein
MSKKNNNQTNTSSVKEDLSHVKKSIWGEMNAVSGIVLLVMVAIVVFSIAAFIFMNTRPPKKVEIIDDAEIFSDLELDMLEDLAKDLKKEHDINVVVATTRDNPYGLTDSDCKKHAASIYKSNCIHTSMQDNSGFCIYIDLTQDVPGGRFFWLYTYGTAFFTVDNEECNTLFTRYKKDLQNENYFDAISSILEDLDEYDFHSTGLVVTYGACIIIPLIIAGLVTLFCVANKKLDPKPNSSEYIDREQSKTLEKSDNFIRKTVSVYHTSSSSGGGGGGGGGHSGGGGGRF